MQNVQWTKARSRVSSFLHMVLSSPLIQVRNIRMLTSRTSELTRAPHEGSNTPSRRLQGHAPCSPPRRAVPGSSRFMGRRRMSRGRDSVRVGPHATVNWLRQMSESGVGVLSGAKGRQLKIVSAPSRPRDIRREAVRAAGDAGPLHHEAGTGTGRRGARGSCARDLEAKEGGRSGFPPPRE